MTKNPNSYSDFDHIDQDDSVHTEAAGRKVGDVELFWDFPFGLSSTTGVDSFL